MFEVQYRSAAARRGRAVACTLQLQERGHRSEEQAVPGPSDARGAAGDERREGVALLLRQLGSI